MRSDVCAPGCFGPAAGSGWRSDGRVRPAMILGIDFLGAGRLVLDLAAGVLWLGEVPEGAADLTQG